MNHSGNVHYDFSLATKYTILEREFRKCNVILEFVCVTSACFSPGHLLSYDCDLGLLLVLHGVHLPKATHSCLSLTYNERTANSIFSVGPRD